MPVAGLVSATPSGSRLILRTLGGAALHLQQHDGAPSLALSAGKPFALLTYLALSPHRSAERKRLLELLWSDRDPEAARNALRISLTNIRKLGPDILGPTVDPVVLSAPVESDYHALVAAWERGDLADVVERFTGDFLPDFALPGAAGFEDWAAAERVRLRTMFARAAEAVVREQLSVGRFRDAESLARRVRDLDPAHEIGWRLLLECLVAGRNALGAAVELAALDRLIGDDALTPGAATRALLAQARQLTVGAAAGQDALGDGAEGATAPLVAELVGREQEFSAVMRAWGAAGGGHVVHVHLLAPAGLGKTRLLADVHARLKGLRARVVHVAAVYGARAVPYAFASDLAGALGSRRGARGVSREAAGVLVALTPSLSAAFDAPPDVSTGDEALRRRALALRELLAALTEDRPLALLLDDLHWGDPPSLRVLAAALGGLRDGMLLVVSTARQTPDDLASVLGDSTVRLDPLTERAVRALLASLAVLPDEPWAARLPTALWATTTGSPLLVLETLALLREHGLLTVVRDQWACDDESRLDAALYEGSALRRRIERLTPEERRAVLLLAAAGIPLSEEQLAAAAGATVGVPIDATDVRPVLASTLASLEQRGIVTRRDDFWSTAHDEHASVLWDSAPAAERQDAASAVGRVLERDAGDAPHRARLAAGLLARGGDLDTLARLFTRFVRRQRLDGDGRSDRAIARELLGAAGDNTQVAALVRALPWHVRARLVSARRVATVVALAVLLPPSVALALLLLTRRPPRPEAVLTFWRRNEPGGTRDYVAVPLAPEQLASAAPIDVDLSRRPTWRVPDSIARFVQAGFDARPDGRGWAMTRAVPDSGVLDVFDVRLTGSMRRLTFGRKDDLEPTWAPDGAALAFATMRWTTHGHYDLAVYDTLTRQVRRLTGPDDDTDEGPLWSPDGSRVAFRRRHEATGALDLCVIDADGTHERCFEPYPSGFGLLGWADAHRVFTLNLQPIPGGTANELRRLDVDTRADQLVRRDRDIDAAYFPSPDGVYALCMCGRPGYPVGSFFVFAVEHPDELKPIRIAPIGTPHVSADWAPTSRRLPYLATLRIAAGPGAPTTDATYQFRAVGLDTAGRPVDVGVMRWRALDSSVATVDSTGLLHPRRAGRVTIEASAGGWRTARTVVDVRAPAPQRVLLDERWAHPIEPTWVPFGEPRPILVPNTVFGTAFSQNGDGSFWSGAWTAQAFDPRGGLWVEADLSVPLTTLGPSQEQHVALFVVRDSARWTTWDRRTGDPNPSGMDRVCILRYPAGSGLAWGDTLSVAATGAGQHAFGAPRPLRDGRPFRVLLQAFPDGRCGFAVDGRATYVSRPAFTAYTELGTHVALYGNSQETRVLVGRVRVGSGVAPHVDWDVFDTPKPTAIHR